MTQNLKELPNGVAVSTGPWLNTTSTDSGFYGYYNTVTVNGSAGWGAVEPATSEGLLYQWSAAMLGSTSERAQGICPVGWHIPSDCEWMYLEHGQGMALIEQPIINTSRSNATDNQGTPSYKLRSAGTGQTNTSGFSSLLNGYRFTNGTFTLRNSGVYFWSSSSTSATTAIGRNLTTSRGVNRSIISKAYGSNVRCLKN
jgi:uncharacterized protein (TIGR02145 family)